MALTLNGSTNTISGLAVGGLPDGIVDTDMIAAEAVSSAKIGNGGVIQVQHTTYSTVDNNDVAAASWWKTNANVSITPTTNSNKILVFGHMSGTAVGPQFNIGVGIYRDNTLVGLGDASGDRGRLHASFDGNHNNWCNAVHFSHLDSPATTSQITYSIGFRNPSSITRTCYINRSNTDTDSTYYPRTTSTITVMEIVA